MLIQETPFRSVETMLRSKKKLHGRALLEPNQPVWFCEKKVLLLFFGSPVWRAAANCAALYAFVFRVYIVAGATPSLRKTLRVTYTCSFHAARGCVPDFFSFKIPRTRTICLTINERMTEKKKDQLNVRKCNKPEALFATLWVLTKRKIILARCFSRTTSSLCTRESTSCFTVYCCMVKYRFWRNWIFMTL